MGGVTDLGSIPGWEDPLEKKTATCSSILAWKIPWTEEPVGLTVHGIAKSWTQLSTHATLVQHRMNLRRIMQSERKQESRWIRPRPSGEHYDSVLGPKPQQVNKIQSHLGPMVYGLETKAAGAGGWGWVWWAEAADMDSDAQDFREAVRYRAPTPVSAEISGRASGICRSRHSWPWEHWLLSRCS